LVVMSISGGTDIISCFMGGCWLLHVHRGEIQCPYLGCDMESWSETGQKLVGERGELVCLKPLPCMPTHFLNDVGGHKYQKAYFRKFPGVWAHGDYCVINPRTNGILMLGRSDTTLNPGGVRFGSAEIYAVVESVPEVTDSLCVGQLLPSGDDERVVLFVRMAAGHQFHDAFEQRLRHQIRTQLSARHVPALVVEAPDIPYTSSGKKVEVAVKQILNDEPVPNRTALANPECLEFYERYVAAQQLPTV